MRGTASRLASNIGLGCRRIQATAAFAGSIHVICRLYRLAWQTLSFVIPGRAPWCEPGIHTPGRGYGFRARDFVAPRNDDAIWSYTAILRCSTGAPDVRLSAASMMALASMP